MLKYSTENGSEGEADKLLNGEECVKDQKLGGNNIEFISLLQQKRENKILKIQNWRFDAKSGINNLEKTGEIKVTDQVEADRKY